MRHTQILQASGRWDVSAIGEYIHYEKGAGEVEIEVNGETHLLSIRDTFIAPEGYTGFKVLNLDASAGEFSFLTGRGQLKVAASGQLTEVTGIASTVDVNLLNPVDVQSLPAVDVQSLPAVDVQSLPPVAVESLPAVDVQSLPAVDVQSLPEVVQKDVSNILTTDYENSAIGSLTIPAKAGRKRVTIQGYSESDNTLICRVSDASKSSSSGQFLPVGAGLLSSLEMQHAAAMKVWFPSAETVYLSVLEEF